MTNHRRVVSISSIVKFIKTKFRGLGDEMRHTVSIVVDLANAFDPDGVDVYFLNRQPMFHVRSSQELIPMFECPPEGKTSTLFSFSQKNILLRISQVQHHWCVCFDKSSETRKKQSNGEDYSF